MMPSVMRNEWDLDNTLYEAGTAEETLFLAGMLRLSADALIVDPLRTGSTISWSTIVRYAPEKMVCFSQCLNSGSGI